MRKGGRRLTPEELAWELGNEYDEWRRTRGLEPTPAQAILFASWELLLDGRSDMPRVPIRGADPEGDWADDEMALIPGPAHE